MRSTFPGFATPWSYPKVQSLCNLTALAMMAGLLLAPPQEAKASSVLDNLVVSTEGGDSFKLNSLNGKVVFLDFWATWCEACLDDFASMDALRQEFHSQSDVAIISIHYEKNYGRWKNLGDFLKAKNIQTTPYIDASGEVARSFNTFLVLRLPRYILIDQHGDIVDRWNEFTPEVLNEVKTAIHSLRKS